MSALDLMIDFFTLMIDTSGQAAGKEQQLAYTDHGLLKVLEGTKTLDKTKVRVGVIGSEATATASGSNITIAEAALINYYGSRAANIPARKFLDIPPEIVEREMRKVADVLLHFGNVDGAFHAAGEHFVEHIVERLLRGDFAPNLAATVAKKGFNHPLMDTAGLVGAIAYELVRESGDKVEGGGDFEQFEIT